MDWPRGSFAAQWPHASQAGSLQAKKSGTTVQEFLAAQPSPEQDTEWDRDYRQRGAV